MSSVPYLTFLSKSTHSPLSECVLKANLTHYCPWKTGILVTNESDWKNEHEGKQKRAVKIPLRYRCPFARSFISKGRWGRFGGFLKTAQPQAGTFLLPSIQKIEKGSHFSPCESGWDNAVCSTWNHSAPSEITSHGKHVSGQTPGSSITGIKGMDTLKSFWQIPLKLLAAPLYYPSAHLTSPSHNKYDKQQC